LKAITPRFRYASLVDMLDKSALYARRDLKGRTFIHEGLFH